MVTLAVVVALFVEDAAPRRFPAGSHDALAAFSLAMIAVAYVIFQIVQRAALADMTKAVLLAAAFLFWAANQFWPNLPQAGLFNDIAIGLFVLDVFLVISGRPPAAKDSFLPATGWVGPERHGKGCGCCDCGRRGGDGLRERVSAAGGVSEAAMRAGSCGRRFE